MSARDNGVRLTYSLIMVGSCGRWAGLTPAKLAGLGETVKDAGAICYLCECGSDD